MKYLVFFWLIFPANICFGQSNVEVLQLKQVGDTYVVDVKFNKNVFLGDCGCLSAKEYSQCILYEGNINLIRFVPEKPTAFDSVSLLKMKYFVSSSDNVFNLDSVYTVTLSPGSSDSYLKVNNILRLDHYKKYQFVHTGAYLSGFLTCYNIGFFNRLFLKLGFLKPQNINYSNKSKRRDIFDDIIKSKKLVDSERNGQHK